MKPLSKLVQKTNFLSKPNTYSSRTNTNFLRQFFFLCGGCPLPGEIQKNFRHQQKFVLTCNGIGSVCLLGFRAAPFLILEP